MTEDITASISGFRTVRTLNFHSRAKAMDVCETDKKKEEKLVQSGKQPSEPSETILPPDQAAWLPVARQILAGEFENADRSTVQSLAIGLRSIGHPLCRRALERLNAENRQP